MANQQVSNLLYIDSTSSQVNVVKRNLRIQAVILNNTSVFETVDFQIADYDSASPRVVLKLKLTSSEATKHFDFSNNPINLPNGLSIPLNGLTLGANATIIYKGNE